MKDGDKTEITYRKVGDYYLPNIIPNKEPEEPLTKYGLKRKAFIRENFTSLYHLYCCDGTITEICLEVQHQAIEREEQLVKEMAQAENVTEELKRKDQLEWVRKMNNIRNRAEEIVLQEIVYARKN